jgi:hypothetical protein
MEWIVAASVILILVFLFSYPSLERWNTRRKRAKDPRYSPPRIMGVLDELYHPDAHATRQIVQDERALPAKAPLAGGKKKPSEALRK